MGIPYRSVVCMASMVKVALFVVRIDPFKCSNVKLSRRCDLFAASPVIKRLPPEHHGPRNELYRAASPRGRGLVLVSFDGGSIHGKTSFCGRVARRLTSSMNHGLVGRCSRIPCSTRIDYDEFNEFLRRFYCLLTIASLEMACVEGIFESTKEGERGNRKNNDVTTLLSIRTDMCLLSFWTVFNGYWIAFSPRSCRLLLRAQLKTSLQCKWTASSMVKKRNNAIMADSSSNTQINSSHTFPFHCAEHSNLYK